jgi:uncharacterized protein YegJ (DUF2314 family)
MSRSLAVVAVLALAVSGCGKSESRDKVTHVADDDPRMNAAIDKAKSTVSDFIAILESPKPGQSGFSVKMPFTDGGETEHMWVSPITYDGKNFHGTVNNEPATVKTVKLGQKVSVAPSNISDWMYLENKKLVGGYTLRVLRDTLSPAERADFDKGVPFVIE